MDGLQRGLAAIIGIAESDLGAVAQDMSPIDLMAQGIQRALADCGFKLSDVDCLLCATAQSRTSGLNLAEYLGMLRRHWKLAAVCCALGLAGAGIHYAITPKAYQATTVIQIERRNLTPLGNTQNPWLENYWNMEFYPTQYELLQSRGLAERVVKSLDLMEDPAFNPAAAREGAKGGTAEADEAVLGALADQIRGGLSVEPVRSTQLVQLSFRAASPEFAAKAANAFAEAGHEVRIFLLGEAVNLIKDEMIASVTPVGWPPLSEIIPKAIAQQIPLNI